MGWGRLLAAILTVFPIAAQAQYTTAVAPPFGDNSNKVPTTAWVNTNDNAVNAQVYGVSGTSGIYKTDGQIGAGGSFGSCDLYSPGTTFTPSEVGWYVDVFGAGAAAATLAAGKITAVGGHHATVTNCESTSIASGGNWVAAPDSTAGFKAALNNANASAVRIPAGIYMITSQITIGATGPKGTDQTQPAVLACGDGQGATVIYAAAAMTTATTNEAMFYRSSGSNGGLCNMTIDAAGLANEAVAHVGGKQGNYYRVWAKDALVEEWECNAGGLTFLAVNGSMESNIFTTAQYSPYNYHSDSSCTDTYVGFSRFSNALTANIYDVGGGQGNHYVSVHPFNIGAESTYQIYLGGGDTVEAAELDGGGATAAIYSHGASNIIVNTWAFFNEGYNSSNIIELATGVTNNVISGNTVRASDSVPAANVVVQDGSAGTGTIVHNNPGASYAAPAASPVCSGSPTSSFATSADGYVTHC